MIGVKSHLFFVPLAFFSKHSCVTFAEATPHLLFGIAREVSQLIENFLSCVSQIFFHFTPAELVQLTFEALEPSSPLL